MSVLYCEHCHKHIDTDVDSEHFNANELCIKREEAICEKLRDVANLISQGELELSTNYKQEIIERL